MDCTNNNLYIMSFVVGADSGLAFVAASNESQAIQILRNGGKYNGFPTKYQILQCRNVGMSLSISTQLLMESYVNALSAYDAFVSAITPYIGPKGDKGDRGESGPVPFDTVIATIDGGEGEPSVDATISGTPGVDGELHVNFHNLRGDRGVSIDRVEQTLLSSEDGGSNEVKIILDNGDESTVVIKNGRRGITGVSAGVDNMPGTPSVVSSYSDDGSLSLFFYGIKGETGAPGRNSTSMTIVDELPEPSESIMDKIFLLYNDSTGKYDVYFVETSESSYGYVQAGSLEVNLEDYKRKDSEIWLTQEEFDAIPIKDATKTYNIYEEEDIETEIPDEDSSDSGDSGESDDSDSSSQSE